jgi:hypothetical protein
MVHEDVTARVKALEEALAECLDWIKSQDVVDDNRADETAWIRDGQVTVCDPRGDQYVLDSLKRHIDETFDLIARSEALLGEQRLEEARSRYRLRRRFGHERD